ncbi:hypothetical protein F4820DRAFT_265794 [Hypoxylon rubiginosum]|uniref:Uncharacterized protein n=1 Tax=Hypoxylon rubiginosum TaxID=110542 RepID=A0ACB9Z4T9_9PEZI|nr:hypothetical protein F4820DRAFT_265794 [Hypoxylon rubiginosum]
MQLQSLLVLLGATALMATPILDDVPLAEEDTADGGKISWYGARDTHTTATQRARASSSCPAIGDVNPVCDSDNAADTDTCWKFIGTLQADANAAVYNDQGYRRACYQVDGRKCCTQWNKDISGLQKKDLIPGMTRMAQMCNEGGVSGKLNNVNIHGACVNQCLNDDHSCK